MDLFEICHDFGLFSDIHNFFSALVSLTIQNDPNLYFQPATIEMPWEVNKANGDPDEPNSKDEECVRMRRGKMNDAVCTRTWSGAMRDNVGMGYVCERHASLVPTQAPKVR